MILLRGLNSSNADGRQGITDHSIPVTSEVGIVEVESCALGGQQYTGTFIATTRAMMLSFWQQSPDKLSTHAGFSHG